VPHTYRQDLPKDVLSGIAVTSLLFAISAYMPFFGFFTALFIPLPVLFYRQKLGRATGAWIPGLTVIVMLVTLGKISFDALFFVELLILGFVLSELFERNLSIEKTVLYACGTVITTALGCLLLYGNISGSGMVTMISNYVARNLDMTLTLYQGMGMSEKNIEIISNSLDQIQYVLVRIIPALAVVSTLFVTWATLLLARPMLVGRKLLYPDFGPLNEWKAPDHLVWGAIGCGLVLLLPNSGIKLIGINGLLILMAVYFFQGIAIVSFFFEKKQFPRMLRFFIYSLVAVQQIMLLLVIGLGFFDMWLNFRKLSENKSS